MYFCNCRGIRERDIKAAIADGCCTYASAYKACSGGQSPQCGRCREDFQKHLSNHYAAVAQAPASGGTVFPLPVVIPGAPFGGPVAA